VDLSTNRVWLVTREEIGELAQQHASGKYHFFMATDPSAAARRDGTGRRCMITRFSGICWRIGLGG
jgi:hypothetical protein